MILIRRPWRPPRSVNDGVQLHWTIISFAAAIINYERHSPLWIETLLARSGSTLIDVGGDSAFTHYPRGKPVLKSIFQRIASLKTFNVCFRHYSSESCRSFLEYPAPNLETLNLIITTRAFQMPRNYLFLNPLFAEKPPVCGACILRDVS